MDRHRFGAGLRVARAKNVTCESGRCDVGGGRKSEAIAYGIDGSCVVKNANHNIIRVDSAPIKVLCYRSPLSHCNESNVGDSGMQHL